MYWNKLKKAQNPYTDFVSLRKLGESKNKKIRAAVAANRNVQSHVIDQLSEDPSPLVRAALVKNPNLTVTAYNKLKEDTNENVVKQLEENWKTPPEQRNHRS